MSKETDRLSKEIENLDLERERLAFRLEVLESLFEVFGYAEDSDDPDAFIAKMLWHTVGLVDQPGLTWLGSEYDVWGAPTKPLKAKGAYNELLFRFSADDFRVEAYPDHPLMDVLLGMTADGIRTLCAEEIAEAAHEAKERRSKSYQDLAMADFLAGSEG